MRRHRFWTTAPLRAAGFLAGTALLSLSGRCGNKSDARGFTPPPTAVEVAVAKKGTVQEKLHALGTVEAYDRVKVSAEIDAVVRELPFEEGRIVREGQPLALFDDRELSAEARRAEALRDQAQLNYERAERLSKEDISSSQDRDNALATLKVAEANVKLAQARLAKTRIVAPFEGVVGRRLVSPGAFLRIGDVITDLARIDRVKVSFAIPERYLADLERGATVTLTTVTYPGKEFSGSVDVIDPILDPATRSAHLVAVIPNPKRELRPGMSADVTAVLAQRENAITVPDVAVFAEGDRNYLYVVKPDSTVTRRAVELGARQPGQVEVRQGLSPGERIVRAGHQKLFEGAKISPVQETPEADKAPTAGSSS
jgi:membrane fusion protein, multidrug efflux system